MVLVLPRVRRLADFQWIWINVFLGTLDWFGFLKDWIVLVFWTLDFLNSSTVIGFADTNLLQLF